MLASQGAPDGTAVLALTQTSGRGSRGRRWSSPPGNLALSVLLRIDEPAARAGEWPLLAAVALADVLLPMLPEPELLSLKWPNDVLLRGRKLAGILIEAAPDPESLRTLAIGIGANLRTAPVLPDRPAAALSELGVPPEPEPFARDLLGAWWRRRAERDRAGFAPIRAAWLARAHPLGTRLSIRLGAEQIEGTFAGLTDSGFLQLRTATGIRTLSAGEVLLRYASISMTVDGPQRRATSSNAGSAIATQPSVGPKSGRATCRKTALPLPGMTGESL
jgi:BirA family transcriptional regulator, biotin operon repressor / biotin---[acetyl-CoA-carboxylase] ligase